MGYFLLFLFVILLMTAGAGLYAALNIGHNRAKPDYELDSYEFTWHEPEYNKKIMEWVRNLPRNYYKVKSPYFYNINVLEIKNNESNKWIILLHGVTLNHKAMLDYAYMMSNMGYNLLLWDSRHHGQSGGDSISYGYYEKNDLKKVIDSLRDKYGGKIKIGLFGVSMGASIVLSYASGTRDDCEFYIADCPYSDFKRQASDVVARTLRLPRPMVVPVMWFATLFIKMFYKYDLGKIRINDKIHRVEKPILIMNCRDDQYIDPEMSAELYEKASADAKEICWFENGGHGGAFGNNREEYTKRVKEYLERISF